VGRSSSVLARKLSVTVSPAKREEVHAVPDPTISADLLRVSVRVAIEGDEVFPSLVRKAHDETVRRVLFLFRLYPHPVEEPLALLYPYLLRDLILSIVVATESSHILADEVVSFPLGLLPPNILTVHRAVLDTLLIRISALGFAALLSLFFLR
jgi:hypothetical protein